MLVVHVLQGSGVGVVWDVAHGDVLIFSDSYEDLEELEADQWFIVISLLVDFFKVSRNKDAIYDAFVSLFIFYPS